MPENDFADPEDTVETTPPVDLLEEGTPDPVEETPEDDEPDLLPEDEADGSDDALFDVDGEQVTLEEMRKGWLRNKDYTQKTTEVAETRRALETRSEAVNRTATELETVMQNLRGFLDGLIPPEPSLELARSDPGRFSYEQALRQRAIAEVRQITSLGETITDQKSALTEAELRAYDADETAKLLRDMPRLANPEKRAAFDRSVAETAKAVGFTDTEIAATKDHRILKLVHFAALGMKVQQNREAAKKPVVDTPATAKARSGTATAASIEAKKAMHRLVQSGSIKDAVKIAFD